MAGALVWPSLLTAVVSIGIGDAITYYTAKAPELRREYLSAALHLVLVQASVVAIVLVFIVPHLVPPRMAALDRLFLIYVPLALLSMITICSCLGQGSTRRFNTLRLVSQGSITIGLIALWLASALTPLSGCLTYVGAEVVTAVCAWTLAGGVSFSWAAFLGNWRPLVAYGLRVHFSSIAALLNERGDQLVISALLPLRSLGLYAVAVSFGSPAATVGSATSSWHLARLASAKRGREAALVLRAAVETACLAGLGAVLIWLLGPFAVRVLVGAHYVPAIPLVRILAVAAVPLGVTKTLAGCLKGLGKPGSAASGEFIGLCAAATVLFTFIGRFGIVAAAWASLAGYSTSLVGESILLLRYFIDQNSVRTVKELE